MHSYSPNWQRSPVWQSKRQTTFNHCMARFELKVNMGWSCRNGRKNTIPINCWISPNWATFTTFIPRKCSNWRLDHSFKNWSTNSKARWTQRSNQKRWKFLYIPVTIHRWWIFCLACKCGNNNSPSMLSWPYLNWCATKIPAKSVYNCIYATVRPAERSHWRFQAVNTFVRWTNFSISLTGPFHGITRPLVSRRIKTMSHHHPADLEMARLQTDNCAHILQYEAVFHPYVKKKRLPFPNSSNWLNLKNKKTYKKKH